MTLMMMAVPSSDFCFLEEVSAGQYSSSANVTAAKLSLEVKVAVDKSAVPLANFESLEALKMVFFLFLDSNLLMLLN